LNNDRIYNFYLNVEPKVSLGVWFVLPLRFSLTETNRIYDLGIFVRL